MHASLILLATSLAASVVGAPVPTVFPSESPAPLMVREVENLKRSILEQLDAIVQRSIPNNDDDDDNDNDVSDANEKRRLASGIVPPGVNYKRDYRNLISPTSNYKRDNRGLVSPTSNYKRDNRGLVSPTSNYKRDVHSEFHLSTSDKRGVAADDGHTSSFSGAVYDKRDDGHGPGYAGGVYDKRDSDEQTFPSGADEE